MFINFQTSPVQSSVSVESLRRVLNDYRRNLGYLGEIRATLQSVQDSQEEDRLYYQLEAGRSITDAQEEYLRERMRFFLLFSAPAYRRVRYSCWQECFDPFRGMKFSRQWVRGEVSLEEAGPSQMSNVDISL